MTEKIPEKMNEKQLDHVKFFILFFVSYFMAETVTYLINSQFPRMFELLGRILQDLTLPVFIVLIMLLSSRLILSAAPELSLGSEIPIYKVIIPPLIISHPFLISLTGTTFNTAWMVLDIFAEGLIFEWVLELVVFGFSGFALYMIQYRTSLRSGRLNQILQYLGKEILLITLLLLSTIYLVRSFLAENLESITLTIPVKLILIILFYYTTLPLPDKGSQMLEE